MTHSQAHFRHQVSSLLDVTSLLEPALVNRWKRGAKSILLCIRSDHILESNVARYLLELLETINALEGLEKFQLIIRGQRSRLRTSVLAAIVEKAKKMTTLEISNAFILVDCPNSDECNRALRQHGTLDSMALLDCQPARRDGIATSLLPLISSLAENQVLTNLVIDSKVLQGDNEEITRALAELGRSSLRTFKLCNCREHGLAEDNLLPMLRQLHTNQVMSELCLYDESPTQGRSGATISAAVAEMLGTNSKLESVLLSVQPTNVPPIIEALRTNTTMKRIRLHAQHQSCFKTVMENLARVLRDDNFVLEQCQLGAGGPITSSNVIEYFLTLNRLGRNFLLTNHEATTDDWVKTVCSHQERTDVVMYFLLKNPSLIDQTISSQGLVSESDHMANAQQPQAKSNQGRVVVTSQSEFAVFTERNKRQKH
ncbi:expressed unknown protein [Seminavis robusta]|uniref:Uncharacterized protein n=1 Tax=Seminavis robusta TaxID=568900 RepID=A0A9N8EH42_9STRA|nr:expressed unknown protein [Seminavis robusta]|eukprot:Sro1156_g247310.1 n/a (428) ;mRNA; r:28946-30229